MTPQNEKLAECAREIVEYCDPPVMLETAVFHVAAILTKHGAFPAPAARLDEEERRFEGTVIEEVVSGITEQFTFYTKRPGFQPGDFDATLIVRGAPTTSKPE